MKGYKKYTLLLLAFVICFSGLSISADRGRMKRNSGLPGDSGDGASLSIGEEPDFSPVRGGVGLKLFRTLTA